mgnify:FL=1
MREIIMGYQGEMSLKGLNRNQFESAMMKILRYRLKTVGKFKVYCTQSTFYMEPEEEDVDMDLAFDRVRTVFGLAALSRAWSAKRTLTPSAGLRRSIWATACTASRPSRWRPAVPIRPTP